MKLLLLLLIIEVVVQKCLSTCNGYIDDFNYTLVVERIYCSQLYLIISYRVPKNSTYVSIVLENAEYSVIGRSFDLNSTSSTANISFTELGTSALLGTQQGVILICPINLKKCFVPKSTSSTPLELLSTTKPSVTPYINSTFKIETEDQQWWFILLIVFPIFILLLIGLVVYFKHPAIAKLKFGCGKSCRLYETNSNKEENCKVSKSDNVISKQLETLVMNTSKPIKLFLIFVNEHKRHEKVIINFVNFLQADLGFEVICELFANEEISLDPVSWMERSLQQADKVIVVWSPGAAKRWKNSYLDIKEDLFTPVLKKIRNDLFREVNMGKYYFGYFDYCTKDNIPKEFNFPKLNHFQLMQQFDELYFRLKGIEKYMPGGVITEDKVLFSRYFDPNLNVFGKALQQSIAEMNDFVKNNPKWHYDDNLSPTDINVLNNNLDENNIKFRELDILPPSPIKVNDTKTTSLSYLNLEKEPFKTSNPFYLEPKLERDEVICENLYSSKDKESKSNLSNVSSLSLEVNDKRTPTLQPVKDVEKTKNSGEINSIKESLKSATSVNTSSSSNTYNEQASTKTIPTSQLKNEFCSPLYGLHSGNIVKTNHRFPVENSLFNGDEDYLRVLETKDLKLCLETATCSDGFDSGYLSGLSDSITSLPVAGDRYQKPIFHLKTVGNTYDNFIHKHVKSDSNEISILKQSTTYEKRTRYQPHVELVPFDLSSDPMLSLMKLNTIKSQ